jgi:hypothetical protein
MPYHTSRPTPHRYLTRCQVQLGLQVLVVPGAATPENAAQGGDHCCPLLELEISLLVGMLKVYDRKGALIHHLASGV